MISTLWLFVVLSFGHFISAQTALDVELLFNVDFSSNDNGGCQYVGKSFM